MHSPSFLAMRDYIKEQMDKGVSAKKVGINLAMTEERAGLIMHEIRRERGEFGIEEKETPS